MSAIAEDDISVMLSSSEDGDKIELLSLDPALEPFRDHFVYRVGRCIQQKMLIDKYEGGLEEFAKG